MFEHNIIDFSFKKNMKFFFLIIIILEWRKQTLVIKQNAK